MIVIYYDKDKIKPAELHQIYIRCSKALDEPVILLPKDLDCLYDFDLKTLYSMRDSINITIKELEEQLHESRH